MVAGANIGRLADELEIRNMVSRLTHLADSGTDEEMHEYSSIYTADGVWAPMVFDESGAPDQTMWRIGREDIMAGVWERRNAALQGPGSHSKHFVTTMMVTFESDDRAMARCNFIICNDTNKRPPTLYAVGEYHNTFVRNLDGWKLARRELYPG